MKKIVSRNFLIVVASSLALSSITMPASVYAQYEIEDFAAGSKKKEKKKKEEENVCGQPGEGATPLDQLGDTAAWLWCVFTRL